jgi:hypothetical protein
MLHTSCGLFLVLVLSTGRRGLTCTRIDAVGHLAYLSQILAHADLLAESGEAERPPISRPPQPG